MDNLVSDPAGAERRRLRLSGGGEMSFLVAGDASRPAVLLLHGFPSSSRTFRGIIPALAEVAYVVAPDLPGFGQSDVLSGPSFSGMAQSVSELMDSLGIGPRYIYLHDFGAPVGLQIAMRAPQRVLGLLVQNANAHRSGQGAGWADTQAFWADPSAENEAKAMAHLTLEGTRDQYVAGVPEDVAGEIPPEVWEEDWRVMNLPGRMETQRALVADYGRYSARFDEIADYLARWQPPALMVWGRHDSFFDLRETQSWMEALPRMEAHVLDGGHFLLETHADAAAALMVDFVRRQAALGK